MKVFDFIDKISHFHSLVMHEATGNAETFAQKLGISRSTLYNIIDELKCCEIEVLYCRYRETFYYRYPENVRINISIEQLNDKENNNICGGSCFIRFVHEFGLTNNTFAADRIDLLARDGFIHKIKSS